MFENYPTKSSSEENLKENIFCLLIVFLYESQLLLIEIFQNFDGNIFLTKNIYILPHPCPSINFISILNYVLLKFWYTYALFILIFEIHLFL